MLRRDFLKASIGFIAASMGLPKLQGSESWKRAGDGVAIPLSTDPGDRSFIIRAAGHGRKRILISRNWRMLCSHFQFCGNAKFQLGRPEAVMIETDVASNANAREWCAMPGAEPLGDRFAIDVIPRDRTPWSVLATFIDR